MALTKVSGSILKDPLNLGEVSIGGTLTYQDVTNVDSVGIITARSGIHIDDSITHIGDTNTKIRFPAADTFTVETNGNERLRILSNGNVGIGSENPSKKLSIVSGNNLGISLINDTGFATAGIYLEGGRNAGSGIVGHLQFYNRRNGGLTSNLKVNGDGNFHFDQSVGIGTVSPDRMLHIKGTGNALVKMEGDYSGSVTGIEGVLTASGANRYVTGVYGKVVNTSGTESNVANIRLWNEQASPTTSDSPGYITFNTTNDGASTPTEKVRITSAGSVGIGTVPASGTTLDIDASGGGVLALRRNSVSTSNKITLSSDGTDGTLDSTNNIIFRAGSNERVRITSGGQLLIGTTTAVRALTIKDPGQIHVESTSTGNWVGMSIKGSSGTNNYNAYFGILDSDGRFFIDNGSNGDDFVITQAGNIGINQTAPEALFHVENDNAHSSTYYLNSDAAILVDNKNNSGKAVIKLEHDAALVYGSGSSSFIIADRQNERLRINSSGFITKPSQAMFEARGNNTAFSAQSPLPYPTVAYNIGNCYNSSTYKFTAPVNGYYQVMAHVIPTDYTAGGNNVELYVMDNHGTRFFLDRDVKSTNFASNNFSVGGTRIIYADAGDTLWLQFHSISGTPKVETASFFSIMLVA